MYHFKIILYIIILILVQSKTLGGPIEETVAMIGLFCNFFFIIFFYFLLKIKYKLYVSILFTSIAFVFASIFKFIFKGPNTGNSPLYVT